MSTVDTLRKVMLPPENLEEAPDEGGWKAIEAKVGMTLPEDYRAFITCYGTGAIDSFLRVLSPFAKNAYLNLLVQSEPILSTVRLAHSAFNEPAPYPLYPGANEIFPSDITDNDDTLV